MKVTLPGAVTSGEVESTTTLVEACAAHPAEFLAVTVYVPALAALADEIVGFWAELENPPGPVQEYDVPPLETSEIVAPGQ